MREWTKEQRRAIEARGTNLLVSAGAGSGKTAVMIERICSLLREGADIRRMVVCTFTRTAAADMKRKLSEALDACDDPRLKRQAALLAGAEISTLHAFCARLLTSRFAEADIDPEFTVLEEGEAETLRASAAERAIEDAKSAGDETFAALYTVFMQSRSHRRLRDTVLAVHEYARSQADPAAWLEKSAQRSDAEYKRLLHDEIRKDAQALCERADALSADLAAANFEADAAALRDLSACMRAETEYAGRTPVLRNKPEWAELHERFKALKGAYGVICERHAAVETLADTAPSVPFCRALAALVRQTDAVYDELKRVRGKLDYADLEHGALRLLRGESAADITGAYDYVFVDEYQDISPLQNEILESFSCNMFYVGDVKQSIYGFRMCRPQYFLQKRADYVAGAGEAVELTVNFRSGGEILAAVNDVFSAAMTSEFGGAAYASAPMAAGRPLKACVRARLIEEEPEEEPPLRAVYSVKEDTAVRADKSLAREADEVVDEILRMAGSERADGEGLVGFGGVAVLVRSRSAFTELLCEKLRAASVPVSDLSSDTAAESFATVSDMLAMLRVIDNACDDVHTAAVLLSPAFGKCTPEELAALRTRADVPFYACLTAAAHNTGIELSLRQKIAAFTAELAVLRTLSSECTVCELAGEIATRFGCFNAALMRGGEREAAALDAFCEHLAGQTEHTDVHEYLRYIDACGTPRLTVREGRNAVRILTVHASKGLEFPCVILPELQKQFNLRDVYADAVCDDEEGIVLRTFDFEARAVAENPRFAACAHKLKRALREEELRILYVALTRAQEQLSLFARVPQNDAIEPYAPVQSRREIETANANVDWLIRCMRRAESAPAACQTPAAVAVEDRPPDAAAVQALQAGFARHAAVPSFGGRVKTSVSGLLRRDADTVDRTPVLYGGDDRAAERGRAYHLFMQWVRFGAENEWERLCARFPREAALVDRAEIERAFLELSAYIGNRTYVREKAFVLVAPTSALRAEGDGNVFVQGVIDLLVLNDDGSAEILDYKTGPEEHVAANPAYERQLALYKRAVEDILGMPVTAAYVYAFSTGKRIKKNV